MLRNRVIYIIVFLAVGATAIFTFKSFSRESKKEISINPNEEQRDILEDVQPKSESQNASQSPEKKIEEKVQPSEKIEPSDTLNITNKLVTGGFEKASGRTIDTIIIHSSYDAIGSDPFDAEGLIREYKSYGVSPHYLIDREGKMYRLVEEKNIAYHAGASQTPDGRSGVNNFSIGIELMNTKDKSFTGKQYDSLKDLIKYIKGRYKIKYILGHNQVSPGRKDDPWNLDWDKID
jgi:N-acetyl-anhydromuramyl-L-alanine amidase AmpD